MSAEICIWCGRSVARGSGLFVNRVPVCNEDLGKHEADFHQGQFVCRDCESCTIWRKTDCKDCGLRREHEDYKELEETAREGELERTNIAKIAGELDDLGFTTSISSEGGRDASDLILTVKKRE